MDCPWCGRPMERGCLRSTHGAFWLPEGVEPGPLPLLAVRKKGGFQLLGGSGLLYFKRTAWVCRRCRRLVADLPPQD